MKQLKTQIRVLDRQLDVKRAELSANVEVIRAELSKPGMLLKGFLVGCAIGYLVIPNKTFQRPVHLQQSMNVPHKSAASSFRDHLDLALRQYFPSDNFMVNVAKILKFL